MRDKHPKFGEHYGVLTKVNAESELIYADYSMEESQNLYEEMLMVGVKEIFLDVEEEDETFSSTMFFSTDASTDFKSLMIIVTNLRPHEFSECKENHFRMWFD